MPVFQGHPELIVLCRRLYTTPHKRSRAQGLAIHAGRVLELGPRRALLALRRRGTRVIDGDKCVITPGLVDCHTHFLYWALTRALAIDVSTLHSLDSVLRRIDRESRKRTVGDWVLAQGLDHNRWGSHWPSARDLDRIIRHRPVMVRTRDSHSVWLNSEALRRAGVHRGTPDPPGGRYLRDEAGEPTGIVQEAAADALPNPLRELATRTDRAALRTVDRALEGAYRLAWQRGFVGVHSVDEPPALAHFQRHRSDGRLGLRVVCAIARPDFGKARDVGLRSGLGDDRLRIGGLKIFVDGSLGSQTAYMFAPYPQRGEFCGVPVFAGDELTELIVAAARAGFACWVHAIGDRAASEALDAFAAARRVSTAPMPHRIEHAQCVRPADIRRMARLGVVASVQPGHLLGDITTADRHWPNARRDAYAFRRMLEAGVTLAGGSDVPIDALDARRGLFGATMRTDERGEPAGGWLPRQRIDTADALAAFTTGAAASVGGLSTSGVLAAGGPADLTLWEDDPLTAPPQSLLQIGIRGCVVGGEPHISGEA